MSLDIVIKTLGILKIVCLIDSIKELVTLIMIFIMQANKLREQIAGVKELIAKKDQVEVEELKQATSNMQQASLKVFELAYKKVST